MSQITDRDCLRYQFRRCARILGEEPWTQRLADHERDRLESSAVSLRSRADGLDDRQARNSHALVQAADIRRQQDSLRRDAMTADDTRTSIPTEDFEAVYVRYLQDAVASVLAYVHLLDQPGDYDGMTAVANRVRNRVVSLVDEMRVYARDILDMAARLAGLPEWRRTCHYQGCL